MEISAQLVKELREKTQAGFMECRKALLEAGGDIGKAFEVLKQKGSLQAQKKSDRQTSEGIISSYIHAGSKIGVLVEVNCETDFVARTEDFRDLVKNLAMHIAASSPHYVERKDIPEDILESARKKFDEEVQDKPETVRSPNVRLPTHEKKRVSMRFLMSGISFGTSGEIGYPTCRQFRRGLNGCDGQCPRRSCSGLFHLPKGSSSHQVPGGRQHRSGLP